jgi:transcriptional antiterminator NusG
LIDEPDQATDKSEPTRADDAGAAATAAAPQQKSADRPDAADAGTTAEVDEVQEDAEIQADAEPEVAQWADDADLQAEDADTSAGEMEDDRDHVAPLEEAPGDEPEPSSEELKHDWYILKVQSNREDSIAQALRRRVKVAGVEEYFDEIIVPVEMVTEFKGGKKKIVKRKLYPGYIVVHMAISEETWFLVRETPGIGDFTGSAGRPTPMLAHEVARIVPKDEDVEAEEPKLQIPVSIGERVKINEGTFENFEGEVDSIDAANGRVTVMINIFGRSTPVELEYWQVEKL